MNKSKEKFITLKEAAEISGYAPDYIGQLIRSGKIEGKQVYSNVAWVTTEKAIREYIDKGRSGEKGTVESFSSFSFRKFASGALMQRLIKAGLYVLIGVGVFFVLMLFYIMSVRIDDYLDGRAEQKAEERALDVPPPSDEVPQLPL